MRSVPTRGSVCELVDLHCLEISLILSVSFALWMEDTNFIEYLDKIGLTKEVFDTDLTNQHDIHI